MEYRSGGGSRHAVAPAPGFRDRHRRDAAFANLRRAADRMGVGRGSSGRHRSFRLHVLQAAGDAERCSRRGGLRKGALRRHDLHRQHAGLDRCPRSAEGATGRAQDPAAVAHAGRDDQPRRRATPLCERARARRLDADPAAFGFSPGELVLWMALAGQRRRVCRRRPDAEARRGRFCPLHRPDDAAGQKALAPGFAHERSRLRRRPSRRRGRHEGGRGPSRAPAAASISSRHARICSQRSGIAEAP